MSESAASTALAPREATSAQLVLSDDEMRRTYRLAESLFLSGMYKDIRKAEAAFAKIVVGRDLGLTPAQSMQGIHMVEGGVQLHYSTLGMFVRERDGYDYRAGWLKLDEYATVEGEPGPCPVVSTADEGVVTVRLHTGEVTSVLNATTFVEVVVVWHDEEDPVDLRPVIGAVVEFTVNDKRRGLSRFTEDDARTAGLIKQSEKAAWNTSRRNMLLARAMSNGVKWFVPEVMGGMPVYTPGEIPEKPSVTAAVGAGDDTGSGVDLGPQVEKVIERAVKLGHAGLSNRAAIELALGNRAPAVVKDWVARAGTELDEFERVRQETMKANADEPEVTDATVVDDEPPAPVSPEDAEQLAGPVVDEDRPPRNPVEVQVLRNRLNTLRSMEASTPEDQEQLNEEIAMVERQLQQGEDA